jgi:hypothetical protein
MLSLPRYKMPEVGVLKRRASQRVANAIVAYAQALGPNCDALFEPFKQIRAGGFHSNDRVLDLRQDSSLVPCGKRSVQRFERPA